MRAEKRGGGAEKVGDGNVHAGVGMASSPFKMWPTPDAPGRHDRSHCQVPWEEPNGTTCKLTMGGYRYAPPHFVSENNLEDHPQQTGVSGPGWNRG